MWFTEERLPECLIAKRECVEPGRNDDGMSPCPSRISMVYDYDGTEGHDDRTGMKTVVYQIVQSSVSKAESPYEAPGTRSCDLEKTFPLVLSTVPDGMTAGNNVDPESMNGGKDGAEDQAFESEDRGVSGEFQDLRRRIEAELAIGPEEVWGAFRGSGRNVHVADEQKSITTRRELLSANSQVDNSNVVSTGFSDRPIGFEAQGSVRNGSRTNSNNQVVLHRPRPPFSNSFLADPFQTPGWRRCQPLPRCSWHVLYSPGLAAAAIEDGVARGRGDGESLEEMVRRLPELTVTDPGGRTGWLVGLTYYIDKDDFAVDEKEEDENEEVYW